VFVHIATARLVNTGHAELCPSNSNCVPLHYASFTAFRGDVCDAVQRGMRVIALAHAYEFNGERHGCPLSLG
jgi:hypothetical protein